MKFTAFLYKRLVDLLNDRRIVVWHDGEGGTPTYVPPAANPYTSDLIDSLFCLKFILFPPRPNES